MDADGNPCFDPCFHASLIQHAAAPGHICDSLAEAIAHRTASFSENDRTPGRVLRDRPAAFSRGRCCGGFRNLSPRKRRHTCQCNAQKHFLHDFPFLVLVATANSPPFSSEFCAGGKSLPPYWIRIRPARRTFGNLRPL